MAICVSRLIIADDEEWGYRAHPDRGHVLFWTGIKQGPSACYTVKKWVA